MVHEPSSDTRRARLFDLRAIGRDYALLLAGFPWSLLTFTVLVPMFALSIGTLVIWVGALLLPLTLLTASFFAERSRARARAWGADLAPVQYAAVTPGLGGMLSRMKEGRRWLDLVFETLLAFPMRTLTFCVALCWGIAAVGEITFPLWGGFLPSDNVSLGALTLDWLSGGAYSLDTSSPFWLEAAFNLVTGCILLLTLPAVLRGLATLEIALTRAGLGAGNERRGWERITTGTVAVISIAVGWPILSALYGVPVVVAMLIVVASATALCLTSRLPLLAILLQSGSVVATLVASAQLLDPHDPLPWPWPVTTLIVQALFTMLVALRNRLPWAIAAWAVPLAVALIGAAPFGISATNRVSIIVSASVSLGVLVVSLILRQLFTSRGDLQAERQVSADLSAHSRELTERNRIAQELHDVVAHSMSVISVQATTAKYRLPEINDEAAQEFESIAASSRQALTEMRGLLALLRSGNEDRELQLAPQPTAGDIPALIDTTRRSGVSVSLAMTRDGEVWADGSDPLDPEARSHLPAATGLTAYRIVQEALSNAIRHSPGSNIDVRVDETEQAVSIEVSNTAPDRAHPQPPAPGAGLGLAGVRERATALGGSVHAGPSEHGGFVLRAVLPLG